MDKSHNLVWHKINKPKFFLAKVEVKENNTQEQPEWLVRLVGRFIPSTIDPGSIIVVRPPTNISCEFHVYGVAFDRIRERLIEVRIKPSGKNNYSKN